MKSKTKIKPKTKVSRIKYRASLDYINQVIARGEKTDLCNINRVLEYFGDIGQKMKVVHITGTNGKGSTAAFTASMLSEMGFRTALFTSPHLVDIRERIKIDGVNISKEDFCFTLDKAKDAYDSLGIVPSFFELMLIIAVLYFHSKDCDFLIAEVGIGGRLDSTNVLKGAVCMITGVSFDHVEYLGRTLEEIAREKTAIVKPGSVLCVNVKDDKLYEFIEKEAFKRNALRVTRVQRQITGTIVSIDGAGTIFTANSPSFKNELFYLSLIGDYQFSNACCALSIIEELNELRLIKICPEACIRGLSKTVWPGRFELFDMAHSQILLDGAHNVEGMLGLCRNVKKLFKNRKITTIISILPSKQYKRMLKIISGVSSRIIVVGLNNIKKNIEIRALLDQAREYHDNVICFGDVEAALDYILKTGPVDLVCITGSLYLIGEARKILTARLEAEAEKSKCVNYESSIKT